jgi:hypothetical protein
VRDFQKPFQFAVHIQRLFDSLPRTALHQRLFGAWDWPIPFSLPELAILELLAEVRDEADFSTVDKFFESAVNLRPALLQDLLRNCRQVKAKRLFLWFSDRHNHTWRQSLDTEEVDLGRGKRMIVKGGSYNPAYQITVPKQMAVGEESPLY